MILYLYTPDDQNEYLRSLQAALPDWQIITSLENVDQKMVKYAAVWAVPLDFFRQFPNLEVIFTLGAGVDALLKRADILPSTKIVRLLDAGMSEQMAEYALYGVLHYQRQMDIYRAQQQTQTWLQHAPKRTSEIRVSILGLGQLGQKVAQFLAQKGYLVSGFASVAHYIKDVACFCGESELNALLAKTDVLICLLPSTPKTTHLLNEHRLALLPKSAAIINLGRGSLIDEDALLSALNAGNLRFVMADVFAVEPLAKNHPFWSHPRVFITPHIGADTILHEAVLQIADNCRLLTDAKKDNNAAKLALKGLVNRDRAY